MSNWQPPSRDDFPSPQPAYFQAPYGQPPFPHQPPRKSGTGRLLLVIALLGGVVAAIAAGAIVVVFQFSNNGLPLFGDQEIDPQDQAWSAFETPEQRRRDVAAGFGAESVGASGIALRGIERFLDEFVAACSAGDQESFHQLVDVDRMVAQVKRHPELPYLNRYDTESLLTGIRDDPQIPVACVRHSLAHVEVAPSGKEARLHVFFWDVDGSVYEFRLWIVRAERRWRLYDWEYATFGLRESADWATPFTHNGEFELDELRAAISDIQLADAHLASSEHDQAEACLQRAAGRQILAEYKDNVALRVAYCWSSAGRTYEFLNACRQVDRPQDVSGALYGQAVAWQQLGRHRRSLEFAEQYEAAIGGGPAVAELKAKSLTALRRFDEAAAEWKKVLAHDRENYFALLALAELLPDDQTDVLRQHVLRCSSPAETANNLAESLVYRDKQRALQSMLSVVAEVEPQSPRHLRLQGLIAAVDGRQDEAAALYLEAYNNEESEELREEIQFAFLSVFVDDGKWEEAYRRAPDSIAAFEYLAGDYASGEYDFPRDDFARIVAAHCEAHPDDPWVAYHQAGLLLDDEKHDEAIALLRAALSQQTANRNRDIAGQNDGAADDAADDDYVGESLQDRLVDALLASGRHLEAYRSFEPRDAAFTTVATRCRWREEPDALRDVVAEHRRARPGDPWLEFYEAVAHMLGKQYDKAEALLARCGDSAEDELLQSSCRSERINNAQAAGNLPAMYERLGDPAADFEEIANRLYGQGNWDDLALLVDAARRRGVSAEAVAVRELELLWQRHDYQEIVARFPAGDLPAAEYPSWQPPLVHDKLLRSLLRLGRLDDAAALAERWDRELGLIQPLLLVEAKRGDPKRIADAMDDYIAAAGLYMLDDLYRDEDIGDILHGDDLRALRLQHPPGMGYSPAAGTTVLLLAEAPVIDEAELLALLSDKLPPDVAVEPLLGGEGATGIASFIVRSGAHRAVVSWDDAPYVSAERLADHELDDPSLQQALRKHTAWLEVEGIDDGDDEAAAGFSRRVAALLVPTCKPLAVFVDAPARLMRADVASTVLAADDFAAAAADVGETVWLYFDGDSAEAKAEEAAADRARRRLREFARAFRQRRDGQSFLLRTDRRISAAREPLWVVVDRIEREADGSLGGTWYVGTLRDGSRIDARMKAGEPVRLYRYNVVDWRIVEGDAVIEGSAQDATKP